jgi:uncharacterized protein YbjT (DUF2867 family)
MAERILVTGATGELGRELVGLLARPGCVVRAATRDPAAARRIFPAEVEVVELDFDRTETYDAAAQWVDRMFLMPPPFDPDAFGTINPFLDWAVSADVRRVVLLSAMDAESMPELALRKVEQHLEGLGIAYTILRPNLYMQNFCSGFLLDGIRNEGRIELCAAAGKVSLVDARDVAAVAAAALRGSAHDGQAFTLTGSEALGFDEAAAILSEATARPIRYVPVGPERMRDVLRTAQWPVRQVAVGVGLFESVARGRRAPVRQDLQLALGRAPTTFAAFAREHATVWR